MKELLHLCTFSGYGGFSIAAEAAGFRTVAFSEVEPFPCRVLAHHWPEVPNLGDIRAITAVGYPHLVGIDLLTGGVPCQPASAAGRRRGAADERWLWPDALRLVRELRPRFAVFENPRGILSLAKGAAFADIVGELGSLGYSVAWPAIKAADVGAPHRRERVFIVAYRQLAQPQGVGGQDQQGCADAGWSVGIPVPWADGGVGGRGIAQGVQGRVGTDTARQEGLRGDTQDGYVAHPGCFGRQQESGSAYGYEVKDAGRGAERDNESHRGGESAGSVALASGHRRREGWPEHAGQQGGPGAAERGDPGVGQADSCRHGLQECECCGAASGAVGGGCSLENTAEQGRVAWGSAGPPCEEVAGPLGGTGRPSSRRGRGEELAQPERLRCTAAAQQSGHPTPVGDGQDDLIGDADECGDGQRAAIAPLGRPVDGSARRLARGSYRWPARPGQDQEYWEAPRTVNRKFTAVPERVAKLKCLGNGLVPAQAYDLLKAIYGALEATS